MWFTIGIFVFVICSVIQFIAMNRIAFGRSIFITSMFILMAGIVRLSTSNFGPFFSYFLLAIGYLFLLFMTWQSILHFQKNK